MIIKLPLMLHNIVSKQFKISHVPCDVIAFAKEEIPENIIRLIHDQYDEKFLDDCDTVLFVKGPIDKDMRKKIFKAADKALGEGANMMNETDFRLLKLHDDDTADFGQDEIENAASDDAEEQTIDDQVNDIVNEPDSAKDDNTKEEADDNTDAVDKTLAAESLEDNSVSSAMHQGKSMKQWADEFKGEFTVNQLWAMARSGQDLQRLLLTMNGISSLDDSELNEAKEEKEENIEDEEENAEDSKEDEDKEKDEDSEAPGKTEENAEDSGSADDSSDSEEDEEVIPTRFVFLKISMKN